MRANLFAAVLLISASALSTHAQECKLKFSVAYTDGKSIQVGLTSEQKKMWDHDSPKKFKGMCLDDKSPSFIILWNQGLNGSELAQTSLDNFNSARTTDAKNNGPTAGSATFYVVPSRQVRGKAIYFILDTSKKPYPLLHQGEGYQDVPQGTQNSPGETLSTSDLASTIPDPVDALSNALKWLKKDKKL
ncbi:MAG TPA: hypothetical protein VL128_13285 [Candidatus Eisenbacteria bacterium]|nr:hypothetical protein [Candidatus Eisenbacteria bacterium]